MADITILHGPNLNLLGTREPHLYGTITLEKLNQDLRNIATTLKHTLLCFQSNAEHELIDFIHKNTSNILIINPAAFTHTSIAIRDALLAVNIPFIEVHLSNILRRESFRHHSYFSDIAIGTIAGFGPLSYHLALQAADQWLNQTTNIEKNDGYTEN